MQNSQDMYFDWLNIQKANDLAWEMEKLFAS